MYIQQTPTQLVRSLLQRVWNSTKNIVLETGLAALHLNGFLSMKGGSSKHSKADTHTINVQIHFTHACSELLEWGLVLVSVKVCISVQYSVCECVRTCVCAVSTADAAIGGARKKQPDWPELVKSICSCRALLLSTKVLA